MPTMARSTDNLPDFPDHIRDTGRWLFTLADHFGNLSSTQKAMFSSAVRTLRQDLAACGLAVPQNLAHTIAADGTLYCHTADDAKVGRRGLNPATVTAVRCTTCDAQVVPARLVREVTR